MRWIDEQKPIELFGDGSQSRDFTYVDDIARGTILAMKPLGYEIINLGGGKNPIDMNYVINEIAKRLNKKSIVGQKPFHVADIMETWADISKAKKLLEWEPQTNFLKGLDKTIEWYRNNHQLNLSIDL
jgi:nucleoside-diphosphate-sugar epimerase